MNSLHFATIGVNSKFYRAEKQQYSSEHWHLTKNGEIDDLQGVAANLRRLKILNVDLKENVNSVYVDKVSKQRVTANHYSTRSDDHITWTIIAYMCISAIKCYKSDATLPAKMSYWPVKANAS